MNKRNDISIELRDMNSVLADMPRTMPYHVPAGYFDQLPDNVHATIKNINEAENVPAWSKKMPYSVPVNYFNELTGNIIAGAFTENADLPEQLPYTVPAGYFENLPAQILAAAKAESPAKKETKVIPLQKRHIFRQMRWLAAAVLILGIGIGSYSIINRGQSSTENMLASVPANDIQDYLQHTDRIDVDRVLSTDINNLQLDNKDIIQYLNETGWD